MASNVVSVRLPLSLVEELHDVGHKDHYKDTSDAIRSLLREKWKESRDPATYQLKSLRSQISQSLKDEVIRRNQAELIKELQSIREMLLKKDGEEEEQ